MEEEEEQRTELILPTGLSPEIETKPETITKLSEPIRNGIDLLVVGLTHKEAAKRAEISQSALATAWYSALGREYAALQYAALNTLLRGVGFQAILTVQKELTHERVDIRLRAADTLLKHLSKLLGGSDDKSEDTSADATKVARQLLQQLNIKISVNDRAHTESSAIIDISGEAHEVK